MDVLLTLVKNHIPIQTMADDVHAKNQSPDEETSSILTTSKEEKSEEKPSETPTFTNDKITSIDKKNESTVRLDKKNESAVSPNKKLKTEEEGDLLDHGWVYIDMSNRQQGPFSTKDMASWYHLGYFDDQLKVKRIREPTFGPIRERNEIADKNSLPPVYMDVKIKQDEDANVQKAFFNARTGRFENISGKSHWEQKNIPSNQDDRLIGHYFDMSGYQEYMRNVKAQEMEQGGPPQRKVTKKQIEYFKKRKEDKKRKRILQN